MLSTAEILPPTAMAIPVTPPAMATVMAPITMMTMIVMPIIGFLGDGRLFNFERMNSAGKRRSVCGGD